MIDLILAVVAATVFFGTIAFLYANNVKTAVSSMYYWLQDKGIYFTVWCGIMALLVNKPLFTVTSGTWGEWLVTVLCMGFIIVGATPEYVKEQYRVWHFTGAGLIIVPSILINFSIWWGFGVFSLISLLTGYVIAEKTTEDDVVMALEVSAGVAIFPVMLGVIIYKLLV